MSSIKFPDWKATFFDGTGTVSVMATDRIRKGARPHLYIKEWMDEKNISDDQMAGRLGLSGRSAVWKLYNQQHRLDMGKAAHIADAIGIPLQQLFYPPGIDSLDAIAKDAAPEDRQRAADIVRRLFDKAS